jgi:hypothetical protein
MAACAANTVSGFHRPNLIQRRPPIASYVMCEATSVAYRQAKRSGA